MHCYRSLFWLTLILSTIASAQGTYKPTKPTVGVCVSDNQMALAKGAGFEFIVPTVTSFLKPNLTDEEFSVITRNENLPPVLACNSFFPSHMKCVGPDVELTSLLDYAETVFKRAKQVGVPLIVFGSGGARNIPDGFEKESAIIQLIHLCNQLAEFAKQYDIKIALENLNKEETNLINTVDEAIEISKQVNMPNFGINVDIYHMLKEGEPASNILKARNHILICDIAERAHRTPPGSEGTDFTDYLDALKHVGYEGGIAVEARWSDFSVQAAPAYQALHEQLKAVY